MISPDMYNIYYEHTMRCACFFPTGQLSNEDILTNKMAADTHVIVRKTQIAQCAAINNWGDTWDRNIIH